MGSVLALIALPGATIFGMPSAEAPRFSFDKFAFQAREFLGEKIVGPQHAPAVDVVVIEKFVRAYVGKTVKKPWRSQSRSLAGAILSESQYHGFDPLLLLAVIQNESQFDPSVIGSHGEVGLMQIKPVTAKWIAEKAGIHWNGEQALRDPAYNVRLGSAYLAMLRSQFGFNQDLYLTAYNMGSKNVKRTHGGKGLPSTYVRKTIQQYSRIYTQLKQSPS
ncbi:lytic transglycosylase domain-containing protein [Bdellovibrionota bacterium FG-1]